MCVFHEKYVSNRVCKTCTVLMDDTESAILQETFWLIKEVLDSSEFTRLCKAVHPWDLVSGSTLQGFIRMSSPL